MSTSDYIKVAEPLVGEEEVQAVREVLLSGMYVSGRRVQEFEEAFAEFVAVKHAVAVSSGTAALQLALMAMGIGQGDEVIVPSLTFFASATAVLHAGAKPVFADIDDDYCLDPDSTGRQLTTRTKAIIPVHYLGQAAKMDMLCDIAEKHGLSIVEDCAQSIGTRFRGRVTGSIGRAGAFSFFATKNMTTGEGGMITTDDDQVAEKARLMRSHGMTGRDDHVILGYNYRMTEMEAAIGAIQLRKLPELNRIRRENSRYLLERIGDLPWIRVQTTPEHIDHTFFWCPFFVREEVLGMSTLELRSKLHAAGVGTRHRYLKPLYSQPMLRENSPYPRTYDITCPFNGEKRRYEDLYFPNAEKYAGRLLGLPNHPGLTQGQLDYIVQTVRSIA
jgi:dTDP-4-amino-4,6-dideoxygalactose transaminase